MVSNELPTGPLDFAVIHPSTFILGVSLIAMVLALGLAWLVFSQKSDQLSPEGEFVVRALILITIAALAFILGETIYLII